MPKLKRQSKDVLVAIKRRKRRLERGKQILESLISELRENFNNKSIKETSVSESDPGISDSESSESMGFEVAYDPEENIKIVQAIKNYPVIYDLKQYPPIEFKRASDAAWTLVAQELRISEGSVRQRWTNIRGCFKRYLKNKAMGKNTKDYYLADYLEFIIPFTKINLERQSQKLSNYFHENDPLSDNTSLSDIKEETEVKEEIEVSLVDSDGEEEKYVISTSNTPNGVTVPEPGSNPDWDFLSSLLPDVRKMTPKQKDKFRNAMLNAIDVALYGEDIEC
ncbi:uncharacterized protein LOC128989939 isoform X1 [Macrosteles quadrilineatus]|uniref:uncharacterized protein LOC128989939 isoform X1 n=1 Tax=Macrosteles quadrilineatus TaxID=74068 RepID=UPI0023E211F5|nr:uncharacterized protein LOC128989939 isoform X1 [Macrosteles quadrilineatus]XP_054268072.1 uncharacterized protein LOC128989939 isoform X1 [Macrosteles quadrilineatus]XP_054268073.1 uncharacterized protein LOC128989939 isoform X1 [Macrosteles quadrilineatus]XP_054268074.1 uncharacterized protein LOC128989939 isoform X1 [Macrosteles quadrilineatus]